MKDIDWSKAPEGATHYSPYKLIHNPFIMLDRGVWYWHNDEDWEQYDSQPPPAHHMTGIITRPTTPQWNGTGLPPVGTVCEVMSTGIAAEWLEAAVVAHDGAKAVYRLRDGRYMADTAFFQDNPARPLFRPARTPEQIAAEERAVAVQIMVDRFALTDRQDVPWYELFQQMYDCGCRMTAEDER